MRGKRPVAAMVGAIAGALLVALAWPGAAAAQSSGGGGPLSLLDNLFTGSITQTAPPMQRAPAQAPASSS
ncbi:MAG: hypothetical protein WBA29_04300, partial [Xanthobacteraceae bacterium]